MPTFKKNFESYSMTCFNPQIIYVRNNLPIDFNDLREQDQKNAKKVHFHPYPDTYAVEIPCGRCIGCRLDHADMWATRLTMEARNWTHNCFITLTYNDHGLRKDGTRNLPLNDKGESTLRKKDIQDFLKRLRWHQKGVQEWINPKNGKKERPIRYFVCGEYGTKGTLRPHYHMALFNWKPSDLIFYKKNHNGDNLYISKELSKIWGFGFVIVGELTHQSASYIARYVQKKAGVAPKTRIYKYNKITLTRTIRKSKVDKEPEFIQMSTGCGLGRTWWEENKDFAKRYGHINIKINGKVKQKAIPRYFKKLWEKEDWEDYHIHRWENIKKAIEQREKIIKQENYTQVWDKESIWKKHLTKMKQILIEKANKLKRNNFI